MKREAVIDSCSLIFSFKVQAISGLLEKRYKCLLVPKGVYEEVMEKGNTFEKDECKLIEKAFSNKFLKKIKCETSLGEQKLGKGELEAINLALKRKLPLITDDRKAKLFGEAIGLTVIPCSSFLLWGMKKGFLNKNQAKKLLNDLIKHNYRLKAEVYLRLIELLGGK